MFPHFKQRDAMDCGPTCLRMIAAYYGKIFSYDSLREKCNISSVGVSLASISDAAEKIGFRTIGHRISFDLLCKIELPTIVFWNQNHFVVVYAIKKTFLKKGYTVYVADPSYGLLKYSEREFKQFWLCTRSNNEENGICLQLVPTPDFYEKDEPVDKKKFRFIFKYLTPYKRQIYQLGLGLLLGSLIQLVFPFLSQALVDYGIGNQNIGFIYLILIAQLILQVSRTIVEFLRSWILLHISSRINISLISDFLIKLMKLPMGYFDTKLLGDITQRIGDHSRIENFLTSSSLNILFSLFNLVIFSIILLYYNLLIFIVFITGSILYIVWIYLFMSQRRDLDFKRFSQLSANQSNIYQLITGMQEIKLNNCERQKRWEWERIQAKVFKLNIKGLSLNQWQQAGSLFLNESKNIFISFLAAKAVVNGDMTLGMMLSVQYIIGQMNAPLEQLISFMQTAQDAKISMERLGEIHDKGNEENQDESIINDLPECYDINMHNIEFVYQGTSTPVLQNINLLIPHGKTTAIVGSSGSGKTTILKLLLGFYPPTNGKILIGDTNLHNINNRLWRSKCGAVLQDGFIFSDSIAGNITVGDETPDKNRLLFAVQTANIKEFIESRPLKYNTKIGAEGSGISQGQKQRILIARAVYKNPEFLFFDEATNALDATNERTIMNNLEQFFNGRTVVVVAHRLSTVKNADQIIVLEKGKIVETGTHNQLTSKQGVYYDLVKNQLELDA